jgi:hypothetical protein
VEDEDNEIYTLSRMDGDKSVTILKAVDDGWGFQFTNKINKTMDYADIDYMRVFLNLIGMIETNLYDSYIVLEPVGQI